MIRTLLVLVWISLVLVFLAPPLILWAILTRHVRPMYGAARFALRAALALAGVRVRIQAASPPLAPSQQGHGELLDKFDPSKAYVFMANHVSNVDPPICFLAIPQDLKVIFKKELLRFPILSTVLILARCIPLDRSNQEAARGAIDQAARQLKQGDSFLIFPEGTRSRDGSLGPFKSGGFVMAILAEVSVVPMTLRRTRAIQPKGSWRLNRGEVEVIFHAPIAPPASIDQREIFKHKVREQIRSAL